MALIVPCFYFRMLAYTYEDGLHIDSFMLPIACSCHIRYSMLSSTLVLIDNIVYTVLFININLCIVVTGSRAILATERD